MEPPHNFAVKMKLCDGAQDIMRFDSPQEDSAIVLCFYFLCVGISLTQSKDGNTDCHLGLSRLFRFDVWESVIVLKNNALHCGAQIYKIRLKLLPSLNSLQSIKCWIKK